MAAISWVCVDGGSAKEEKRENSCEGCPQSSGNRKLLETRLPAGKRRRLVCVIDGPCHVPVDFELICFSFFFSISIAFSVLNFHFHAKFYAIWLGASACTYMSWPVVLFYLAFDFRCRVKFSAYAELSLQLVQTCTHTHTSTHMPSGSTEQVNDANDFGFRMGPHRFTRQDVRPFALCSLSL